MAPRQQGAKPRSIKKDQLIAEWLAMEADQPIRPRPIPYKQSGSSYSEDGIRITGSEQFIMSVLSHLKELIYFEATDTRLSVSFSEQVEKSTEGGKPTYGKDGTGAFSCYIKVAERGPDARMAHAFCEAFSKQPERLDI